LLESVWVAQVRGTRFAAAAKFSEKPSSISETGHWAMGPRNNGAMNTTAPSPHAPSRLVLDTNAVLDAWVFADVGMAPVLAALASGQVLWLASPAMRQELVHALALPQLQRWQADCVRVLGLFDSHATMALDPPTTLHRSLWCSDNYDQIFIDLALAQRARWLLTKDRALLRLARHARRHGVQIVPPLRWSESSAAPEST
jgi:putative PIN family toxin of toxin-antitoxin system